METSSLADRLDAGEFGMFQNQALTRREYMRNEGFVLASDLGHMVMEAGNAYSVREVEDLKNEDWRWERVEQGAFGVGVVAIDLARRQAKQTGDTDKLMSRFGITKYDVREPGNKFQFRNGLGDQDFTWHFAAGVASQIVYAFEDKGYISAEQRQNLSLADWANVIGSGWFSTVLHDMALTSNGVWGSYGYEAPGYMKHGLYQLLRSKRYDESNQEIFDTNSLYAEDEGMTYLVAQPVEALRRYLRTKMKDTESPGCPVARRSGTLASELVEHNLHARKLFNEGLLVAKEARDGKVRFTQEYTPIDRALDVLALYLDRYDQCFGTPLRLSHGQIVHEQLPQSDSLMHVGDVPFTPLSGEHSED